MSLFVGRLSSEVRTKDLHDLFNKYGHLTRCDLKGSYAFITLDDERDAEDAMAELQGKELFGARINIEWAKGSGRYDPRSTGRDDSDMNVATQLAYTCFECGERGHFARDCRRRGGSGSSRRKRSYSPRRNRYSPRKRSRRSRSRSYSRSPAKKRSRSRSRSRSPKRVRRSASHSRSPSPKANNRSRSRSRSRSGSPSKRRERSISPSTKERERSRSPSPKKEVKPPVVDK